MNTADQRTVAIKSCCACGAALVEENKFCRQCGASQPELHALRPASTEVRASEPASVESFKTTKLQRQILYHPVSGPLVKAVVAGVPANASRTPATRLHKRMLLALMAIPIWVMIILLSPIDAYASAKIIGQRI